jgi:hypothetical protein
VKGRESASDDYLPWRRGSQPLRLFLEIQILFKELRMASTILNRVSENLNAAGCSRAILATVCGLKASTLSAAYAGVVNLGHREADLLTASHRILDGANALRPLPLPSDAASVAVLVNRLTDGTLTPEKIRETVQVLFEQ